MLEKRIKEVVPEHLKQFSKLTPGHDPYYFDAWDNEVTETIIRYWFWNKGRTKKNRKRVFVSEITVLLKNKLGDRQIDRGDFELFCPKTNRDGGCGFAVIIRILEYLDIVRFNSGQYQIHNPSETLRLLNQNGLT